MRVLPLLAVAVFTVLFSGLVLAQNPSPCGFGFGSEKAFDALANALSDAKSCGDAVRLIDECEWGSSADSQFAAIVVEKCENAFFQKLSKPAKTNYEEAMQLCAYEYAKAEGTISISEAALCQVGVAAGIAANPAIAERPIPHASFDCTKAQSSLEKAICSDTRLGHADLVLGRVYKQVLRPLKGKQATDLVGSEQTWLAQVVQDCRANEASSLSLAEKNCVAIQFENRFTDLDSCQDVEANEGNEGEGIAECLTESAAERKHEEGEESDNGSRASFDCEKPDDALEIAICADNSLGREDIEVADAYKKSLASLSPKERRDLIKSEKRWLDYVQSVCPMGVVGGIPGILTRSCIRTAFETRQSQLEDCVQKPASGRANCLNDFKLFDAH